MIKEFYHHGVWDSYDSFEDVKHILDAHIESVKPPYIRVLWCEFETFYVVWVDFSKTALMKDADSIWFGKYEKGYNEHLVKKDALRIKRYLKNKYKDICVSSDLRGKL